MDKDTGTKDKTASNTSPVKQAFKATSNRGVRANLASKLRKRNPAPGSYAGQLLKRVEGRAEATTAMATRMLETLLAEDLEDDVTFRQQRNAAMGGPVRDHLSLGPSSDQIPACANCGGTHRELKNDPAEGSTWVECPDCGDIEAAMPG